MTTVPVDDDTPALTPTSTSSLLNDFPPSILSYDDVNSDCFQEAISSIRAHCDDALVRNTEERIKGNCYLTAQAFTYHGIIVAISLTLCELATAKYNPPPLECLPNIMETTPHDISSCVGLVTDPWNQKLPSLTS